MATLVAFAPPEFNPHQWDDVLNEEQLRLRDDARMAAHFTSSAGRSTILHTGHEQRRRVPVINHSISTALQSGIAAMVLHLPNVLLASDDNGRRVAWENMAKGVATAMGIGAGVGGLCSVIQRVLAESKSSIFEMLASDQARRKLTDFVCRIGGAITVGIVTAGIALGDATGHLITAAYRLLRSDWDNASLHWRQALRSLSLSLDGFVDRAAFSAAHITSTVALNALLPTLPLACTTGPLAPCLTVMLYGIGHGVAWWAHQEVDVRNHWRPTIRRWFCRSRKETTWSYTPRTIGAMEDRVRRGDPEDRVPDLLLCGITKQMVTEPVRFRVTGQLYEKSAIMRALRDNSEDPLTRIPAIPSDYVPALQARRCAEEVAKSLSLVEVLVRPDEEQGLGGLLGGQRD